MSRSGDKPKIYFVDTSVLIHDPHAFERFGEHDIILSSTVTQELDANKSRKYGAREALRQLDRLVYETLHEGGDISKGMPTKGGGKVFFFRGKPNWSHAPNFEQTNDLRIVVAALDWQKTPSQREGRPMDVKNREIVLVSKDTGQRLTAIQLGLQAQDYKHDKLFETLADVYTGRLALNVRECAPEDPLNLLHRAERGVLPLSEVEDFFEEVPELLPNVCCTFRRDDREAYAIYDSKLEAFRKVCFRHGDDEHAKHKRGQLVTPWSPEQAFLLSLLRDPDVKIITVMGPAGSGKTLLALAAGIEQLTNENVGNGMYDKVMVLRPMIELGEKLGYLPGGEEEKYRPWTEVIHDQLDVLFRGERGSEEGHRGDELMSDGRIAASPINFMRGRSLGHIFTIVDEAQNLTPHEVKTLGTRVAEGSKLILTGDPSQIDTHRLDEISNGLVHIVGRSIRDGGSPIYGHITLYNSVRSDVANFIANRL